MSDSDEIYRVLDPDPPVRRGAKETNKDQKGVNEGRKSVDEEVEGKKVEGNANFVQVIRQGVVETRKLPQNPVKARLAKDTEKIIFESSTGENSSKSSGECSESNRDSGTEEQQNEVRSGEERMQCSTEESYASRAARTTGPVPGVQRNVRLNNNNNNNRLPGRPCTAFFIPGRDTSPISVFDALELAEIGERDISCLHRRMGGEVQITFRTTALKEKFLKLNSIEINGGNFALQDVDRPLTFLTIYDCPHELPDLAVTKRLEPYCHVLHTRRGHHATRSTVCNGLRHYRVRVFAPIPSYLRFGRFLVQLRHSGQRLTCRRCNRPGHFASQCSNIICLNCEQVGHEASQCPSPILCNICKTAGHLAYSCRYNWHRGELVQPMATDEAGAVDVEGLVTPPHQTETPPSSSPSSAPAVSIIPEIVPDTVPEIIPETVPETVPPSNDEQAERIEPMTGNNDDRALDSQGLLIPESTPITLIPRPPPLIELQTPNRFDVLTVEMTETTAEQSELTEETPNKKTETEEHTENPTTSPETLKPPPTPFVPHAISPSPLFLPQRSPSVGRRKPAVIATDLTGCVRKATSPQPVVTGKSKFPVPTTSTEEEEEEMEVLQVQGRKRGPDGPPPKSSPKRKGSRSRAKARSRPAS